jgi:histidinol-phosphate aminotransferase
MLSTVACDAALAALNEDAFVAKSWQKIKQDRQIMVAHLTEAGYRPVPTTTIYMLLPVPSGSETHRELLRRGVLVRDTSSYGLDGYIRVCTRPLNDVFALVEALTYKSK